MIRKNTRPVDTEFGTFYIGVTGLDSDRGPEVFAETETGEVTVNGVTYTGSIYFRRPGFDPTQLYADTRHLNRWDERRAKFLDSTESARRKLDAALRPHVDALLADDDHVHQRRTEALRMQLHYKLTEADRAIAEANEVAQQLRDLGDDVADAPLFNSERP